MKLLLTKALSKVFHTLSLIFPVWLFDFLPAHLIEQNNVRFMCGLDSMYAHSFRLFVCCVLMWNCLSGGDIWGDPLKITPKREVSKRSKMAKPLPEADGAMVIPLVGKK